MANLLNSDDGSDRAGTEPSSTEWYAAAMEKLIGVVQELSKAYDLESVMEVVRVAARELTGCDGATFVLRDDDKCFYAEENAIEPLWKGLRFPMTACISGWTMLNRRPAVIEDIFVDPRIPVDAYKPTFVKSLAMVPIRTRDPIGAIGNYWATTREPREEEVRVLQALADTTAVAMENVRVISELEKRVRDLTAMNEAVPVAILSLDPEGAVSALNPAAANIFGTAMEETCGKLFSGIDLQSADTFETILNTIREGGSVKGEALKGITAAGRVIDLRLSGGPVHNEDGTLRSILLAIVDETERNQLERQFLQAQKMDAIGQLTGGIAHDFNNLLAILIGNLDLILEQLEGDSDTRVLVEEALEAAMRGAALNKRMLAFARRQALQPEDVAIEESMATIVKLLKRSLGERVEISLHCADGIWPVYVDPVQLETAIVNLGVNARDAMPGGGMLTIEAANVQLEEAYTSHHAELEPGDYVMVAVSDTGGGMSAETISRVFEPFFTTKPLGKGTGLGLSMIYGFIKQSGGHVHIYSEVGKGTTVRLYLPRGDKCATPEMPEASAEMPAIQADCLILLVEDNDTLRRVALRQLHQLGYVTEEARTADEALSFLESGLRPAVLFSDVVIPGSMDGVELAERASDLIPGLAVVLTSGFTERVTVENMRREGRVLNFPLLDKPYRKSALGAALHDAMTSPPRR